MTEFLGYLQQNLGQALFALASVISIGAGLLASYTQAKSAEAQHQEQIAKMGEVIDAQKGLIEEQRNMITGGDSFLFFEPLVSENRLILSHFYRGKYPMYEVKVTVFERDYMFARPGPAQDARSEVSSELGTVQSFANNNYLKEFRLNMPEYYNGKRIIIKIQSRNLQVYQDIYIQRKDGVYTIANKVDLTYPNPEAMKTGWPYGKFRHLLKELPSGFDQNAFPEVDRTGDTSWAGDRYEFSNINDLRNAP